MDTAFLSSATVLPAETGSESFGLAADTLRLALERWSDFGPSYAAEVQAAAEAAADAVLAASWPKRGVVPPERVELVALAAELVRAGARPAATTDAAIERATGCVGQGPGGIAAAMLLVAPWDLPGMPSFATLPDELWAAYAAWLFTPATGYNSPGDARRHAEHVGVALTTLADWAERNLGAPSVRAAAKVWLDASLEPVGREADSDAFKTRRSARGRLLRRSIGCPQNQPALTILPRAGRAVRVGFVARVFDDLTRLRTAPLLGGLDAGAFEVACYQSGQQGEFAVAHAGRDVMVLPFDPSAQQEQLFAAGLDVLVFLDDLAGLHDAYSRLGLLRLAPLQIATRATEGTTGLPQIDLYLAGESDVRPADAKAFTERLALLPGSADFLGEDLASSGTEWSRATIDLLPASVVLFGGASHEFITPEVLECWASILAGAPEARLLLVPFHPRHPGEALAREFQARLDAVFDAAGIGGDRVALLDAPLAGPADVASLARLADLALDVPGDALTADAACIAQVPLVALASCAWSRSASGRLHDLGLGEMAVATADEFVRLAINLANNADRRAELRERFTLALDARPYFQDPLAVGADFGRLLALGLDELEAHGARRFRRRSPLQVAAPFNRSPAGLRSRGEAASASGDAALAQTCFLAAIHRTPRDAALWLLLAQAYEVEGSTDRAVESLEASLRLDETCVEAWLMFARLAHQRGVSDLANEALGEARKLAPTDPRVAALAVEIAPLA